jgi:hypothetical protein
MDQFQRTCQNTFSDADANSPAINPAWVAFFAEAMRLAELVRQRRAARAGSEALEDNSQVERSIVSEDA